MGAILLTGWILMAPPLVGDSKAPGGYRVDLSAKVENWRQVSAHDSAADCERAKSDKALNALSLAREKSSGKKDAMDDPVVDAAMNALCVPADYIYGGSADAGQCPANQQSL